MNYDALLTGLADNELAWLAHYVGGPRGYDSRETAIATLLDHYELLSEDDPRAGVLFRYFGTPDVSDLLARGLV